LKDEIVAVWGREKHEKKGDKWETKAYKEGGGSNRDVEYIRRDERGKVGGVGGRNEKKRWRIRSECGKTK